MNVIDLNATTITGTIPFGNLPVGGGAEAFGLVCTIDGVSGPARPEVRDCVVEAPPFRGGSCLGVNNDAAASLNAAGLIDNNTVFDNFSSNGIALAGRFDGLLVTRNHVVNAARGFHQDTVIEPPNGSVSENVRIEGNFFEACQVMVGLGSQGRQPLRNYVIADNTHTGTGLQPNAAGYGNFTPVFIDTGVTGTTVADNRFGFAAAYATNPGETIAILVAAGCGDVAIVNNVFDSSYVSGAAINPINGTKLIACWGNRYTNGSHLPGLEDQSTSAVFGDLSVDGSASVTREVFRSGNLALGPTFDKPKTRYRLRMALSINPGTYSAHIPAYLIRASTDDGKGYLALITAVRSFTQSPPQLRIVLLEGSGLKYVPNLTYQGGTIDFTVIKPPTSAQPEIYSFTVTQIGLTDKYSVTVWSTDFEQDPDVLAGTAAPNAFPPLRPDLATLLVSSLPGSGTPGQLWSDGQHFYGWCDQGTGTYAWKQLDNAAPTRA